jgi:hypothetical protein
MRGRAPGGDELVGQTRLTLFRRRPHLLDHVNDGKANFRVGDPQECPDEPGALEGIIGLWRAHCERARPNKLVIGFPA